MIENLLVALVVVFATAYAAWALAPRTLRRQLANRALAWSQGSARCPQWLRTRLKIAAATASATACDACGTSSGRRAPHADVPRKHT